jgi:hypothetical protein
MFQHLPFLLKDCIFPSGLLVGVVNQYDLQRILRSVFRSCAAKERCCLYRTMRSSPTLRPHSAPVFRIAKKCYVGLVCKSSRLLDGERNASNSFSRVLILRCYHPCASSFALCAALTTALMSVTRSLPSSSSRMPSMVHPAGVVTASFKRAG